MKNVYLRNFVATATLVFMCFLLVAVSFVGIGRGYIINDYRERMDNNASEVARTASAIADGDSLTSWSLSMTLSSISRTTGNQVFITDETGKITDTEDRYTASFIGVAPMDDPQIEVLVAINDLPESAPHGGGAIAAPVVGRIMEDVLPYIGVTASYDEDESDRREQTVPNVIGMTRDAADEALTNSGFEYIIHGEGETVTDQVPSSGIRIPASGRVILYMGEEKPTEQIEVPDVSGMDPDTCRDTLEEYGLYLKQRGVATSQITGDTTASSQSPAAGTKVSIGSVITVEFSDTTTVNDR